MGQGSRGPRFVMVSSIVVAALALAGCTSSSDSEGGLTDSLRSTTSTAAAVSTSTTTTIPPTTTTIAPTTTTVAPPPPPAPGPAIPAGDDAVVTRVTDGDTIVVNGSTKVRLIGVDTPETYFTKQCYGPNASTWMNEALREGTRVRLEYDANRTDRYGRTLAYVYRLSDGLNLQVALLQQGFAAAYPFDDTPRYHEWFADEARRAKAAGVGGWSECVGQTGPLAGPAVK